MSRAREQRPATSQRVIGEKKLVRGVQSELHRKTTQPSNALPTSHTVIGEKGLCRLRQPAQSGDPDSAAGHLIAKKSARLNKVQAWLVETNGVSSSGPFWPP